MTLSDAGLETLLGVEAGFLREGAVVGRDVFFADALREMARDALHHAARVGEDQRGVMFLDELRELVVHRGPHLARHHRLERRRRHDEVDVALADVPGVDDAVAVVPGRGFRGSGAKRQRADSQVHVPNPGNPSPAPLHPPPGTSRLPRWASASRTSRCAAPAARRWPPAAPASATGARRAWSARRHGFRRRSRCARSAASRAPRRWSAVDRATPASSPGCAAAIRRMAARSDLRGVAGAHLRADLRRARAESSASPRKSPRAARRDCAGCRSTAPSAATRTPRA